MDVRDRSVCFLHNWGEDEVGFTPALPDRYPLWHIIRLMRLHRTQAAPLPTLCEVKNSDVGVNNQSICPNQWKKEKKKNNYFFFWFKAFPRWSDHCSGAPQRHYSVSSKASLRRQGRECFPHSEKWSVCVRACVRSGRTAGNGKEKKRCHYIRTERTSFLNNTLNALWLAALCRCHVQSNLPPTAWCYTCFITLCLVISQSRSDIYRLCVVSNDVQRT